jgi:hypothetical protein
MKVGSYLMYKCRFCGETFSDGHAPDGPIALAVAEGRIPKPEAWGGDSPGIKTLHFDCTVGGTGIADLIGILPDDQVERR